jgi:membrane associated rhomboid family serine protease
MSDFSTAAEPFLADRWRGALVRVLTRMPDESHPPLGFLAQIEPWAAVVVLMESGQPIVLLTWPEQEPGAVVLMRQRIAQTVERARPGLLHIVLVGGGEEGWALCREQQPFWQLDRRVALHHVDEQGQVRHAGEKLKLLDEAAREVNRSAESEGLLSPLTLEELQASRQRVQQLMNAEETLSKRLSRAPTHATSALILSIALLFVLEVMWGHPSSFFEVINSRTLMRMGALAWGPVARGEVWRLLSCTLLHGSLLHVAVNGWSLWALGRFVEKLLGSSRYLSLYVLTGLVGSIASVLTLSTAGLSVGASGALFGVMGGLVALTLRPGKVLPPTIAARIKRNLWPVLLLNLVITMQEGIDKSAHIGGFVAGLVLAGSGLLTAGLGRAQVLGTTPLTTMPRKSGWATGLAGVAVAALFVSVILALVFGQPWSG